MMGPSGKPGSPGPGCGGMPGPGGSGMGISARTINIFMPAVYPESDRVNYGAGVAELFRAMASISTRAPFGNAATAIVERAGLASSKYAP